MASLTGAGSARPPARQTVGVIMNGVTGRMGTNQHLVRSILAIRRSGGIPLPDGTVVWPEPLLVGRSEDKLRALAEQHGLERWTTRLEDVLDDPAYPIYFDAQITSARPSAVRAAIAAGKHVYCEKPIAPDTATALDLARRAREGGVKNGVVQDKLFLPGLLKLKRLVDEGFFGSILAARGEFGYWVFEGPEPSAQRPSWNYREEDGGGIVLDMFCHWRYVLDHILGPVQSVSALGATHVLKRYDEQGRQYRSTADDAAYATFEVGDGIVVQLNSSWCVRVNREELFELQVDGTDGSAVAGLRRCKIQTRQATPRAVWNPDVADPTDYRAAWQEVPDAHEYENAFAFQWRVFLRHVMCDEPFPWDFLEGAKGVQLAELGLRSGTERRVLGIPELTV